VLIGGLSAYFGAVRERRSNGHPNQGRWGRAVVAAGGYAGRRTHEASGRTRREEINAKGGGSDGIRSFPGHARPAPREGTAAAERDLQETSARSTGSSTGSVVLAEMEVAHNAGIPSAQWTLGREDHRQGLFPECFASRPTRL